MLFLLRRSLRTGSTLPLAQILGGNGNALHVPSLSRSYSLSSSLIVSDQLAVAAAGDGTLLKFRPVLWISRRFYCNLTEDDIRRRVEEISALFFEARELLDDARASANTVYFNEDMKEARTAVEEAIGEYNKLLGVLSEAQMQSVVTAIGLKMEELKAHLAAITEELDDSS